MTETHDPADLSRKMLKASAYLSPRVVECVEFRRSSGNRCGVPSHNGQQGGLTRQKLFQHIAIPDCVGVFTILDPLRLSAIRTRANGPSRRPRATNCWTISIIKWQKCLTRFVD